MPGRAPGGRGTPTVIVHYDDADSIVDIVRGRQQDAVVYAASSHQALTQILRSESPDILFTVRFDPKRYPKADVLACPSLQWISVGGVGTDHIAPWDPDRLIVTNAAGVASGFMAQYAMAGIYAFAVGLPAFAEAQRAHRWAPGPIAAVAGKTLLVAGLGRTGRATAELARRNGMNVLAIRSRRRSDDDATVSGPERLVEFAGRADYVLVSVPLTRATRGMIGKEVLSAMKPGAVIIDVSRGGVIDESALTDTLRTGAIGGAMLDVFAHEPLPDNSPFWDMPNVIVTPHSAGLFSGWERHAVAMFCDNLDRWRRGEPLSEVVDPLRGY
jgi:phosphoglycerate dehydrogenase-like enzyme